jgi:arylsulfatase A-like enzyme
MRGKFCFFDGSARLPLIARLPGRIPAGTRTDALVDQADFVPTFLTMAGINPASRSQDLDGQSFTSVLGEPSLPGKRFAFGEYAMPHRPFYMRRDNRWKYVYYTDTASGASANTDQKPAAEELYDTVNDAAELTNLADDADFASVTTDQRDALFSFLKTEGVPAF